MLEIEKAFKEVKINNTAFEMNWKRDNHTLAEILQKKNYYLNIRRNNILPLYSKGFRKKVLNMNQISIILRIITLIKGWSPRRLKKDSIYRLK